MATKRQGVQTIRFQNPPSIAAGAAIVGKKEGEGPLGKDFDKIEQDPYFGQTTWEKAESYLLKTTIAMALEKAKLTNSDINYIYAGDLLNQCTGTNYGLRELGIPFFGLFGACSTMAESLILAAMAVDGDFSDYALAATSSHFCSAERQFRFPVEYGGQRTPTSQWTVTGCGAAVLATSNRPPYITFATTGKIADLGVRDANNMGAAMAPAFAETVSQHFADTGRQPDYYDLIVSGDLGFVGKAIAVDLLKKNFGYDLGANYNDCGCMIFDPSRQDTHAGGSGCGCSASVLCSHILKKLQVSEFNKVLFIATGALMSPTTLQQGESIPCIAHAVAIENFKP